MGPAGVRGNVSDLFPNKDLSNFGLLPDASSNLPIGVSRRDVPHLAGLSSIGVNCAACHVGEIDFVSTRRACRSVCVLGMTSHFDAEAFLGAVIVATFRTSNPTNMQLFLVNYLAASDPLADSKARDRLASEWNRQEDKIIAAIANRSDAPCAKGRRRSSRCRALGVGPGPFPNRALFCKAVP